MKRSFKSSRVAAFGMAPHLLLACGLLGTVIVLPMGCSRFTKPDTLAANALIEGRFSDVQTISSKWLLKDTNNSLPHFVAAVALYLSGAPLDKLEPERAAVLSSQKNGESTKAILQWIAAATAKPENDRTLFLRGLAAQLQNRPVDALSYFKQAAALKPSNALYLNSALAVDPGAKYAAVIPKGDPLIYKGVMRMRKGAWVPDEEELKDELRFRVTNGSLTTKLGDREFVASFGGWSHVTEQKTEVVVAWAANLVRGSVLVANEGDSDACGPADGRHQLHVQAVKQDVAAPFDFFGKFRIVTPGEASPYPVMMLKKGEKRLLVLSRSTCAEFAEDYKMGGGVIFGAESLRMAVDKGSISGKVGELW